MDHEVEPNEKKAWAAVHAAGRGDLFELEELIRAGADVEARNAFSDTALMRAACMGKYDCHAALLKAGARKDAVNRYGVSALHYAAYGGNVECLALLARAGSDMQAKDHRGNTPAMVARNEGHPQCEEALQRALALAERAKLDAVAAPGVGVATRAAKKAL